MRSTATRSVAARAARVLAVVGLAAVAVFGTATTVQAATSTPAPGSGPQVYADDTSLAVGDRVVVRGTGWPAGTTVAVTTCGNYALNLSADCDQTSQAGISVSADGTFSNAIRVGKPPTPCPCVIRAVDQQQNISKNVFVNIAGLAEATPTQTNIVRSLTADVRITGSGPVSALFGGAAKRTLVLTVKNTGTAPFQDPAVTVFGGKGSDPTKVIAQPKLGAIAVGQTVTFEQPFTISTANIGTFRVRAVFTDVAPIVNVTATTSTYPWLLIGLAVLLLQIPLLGLYKKRPVTEDYYDEDPMAPAGASVPVVDPAPAYAFAAADVGMNGMNGINGGNGHVPAYAVVGAAAVGALPVLRPAAVVDPYYRPVFGVTDLRAYLAPGEPTGVTTVAPRVVIGGVVPRDPSVWA